jgi:hypothetical protein
MMWKESWSALQGGCALPSHAPRTMRSGSSRLFCVERTPTIFTALVAVFVLPDFPSICHSWLFPIEVGLAGKRMEGDASVDDEDHTEVKSQLQILFDALTDWKTIYTASKYVILQTPREHVRLIR